MRVLSWLVRFKYYNLKETGSYLHRFPEENYKWTTFQIDEEIYTYLVSIKFYIDWCHLLPDINMSVGFMFEITDRKQEHWLDSSIESWHNFSKTYGIQLTDLLTCTMCHIQMITTGYSMKSTLLTNPLFRSCVPLYLVMAFFARFYPEPLIATQPLWELCPTSSPWPPTQQISLWREQDYPLMALLASLLTQFTTTPQVEYYFNYMKISFKWFQLQHWEEEREEKRSKPEKIKSHITPLRQSGLITLCWKNKWCVNCK